MLCKRAAARKSNGERSRAFVSKLISWIHKLSERERERFLSKTNIWFRNQPRATLRRSAWENQKFASWNSREFHCDCRRSWDDQRVRLAFDPVTIVQIRKTKPNWTSKQKRKLPFASIKTIMHQTHLYNRSKSKSAKFKSYSDRRAPMCGAFSKKL